MLKQGVCNCLNHPKEKKQPFLWTSSTHTKKSDAQKACNWKCTVSVCWVLNASDTPLTTCSYPKKIETAPAFPVFQRCTHPMPKYLILKKTRRCDHHHHHHHHHATINTSKLYCNQGYITYQKKKQISPNPSLFFLHPTQIQEPQDLFIPHLLKTSFRWQFKTQWGPMSSSGTFSQVHHVPGRPVTFFSHGMRGITNLNLDTWFQKRHETDQKALLTYLENERPEPKKSGGLWKMMFLFNWVILGSSRWNCAIWCSLWILNVRELGGFGMYCSPYSFLAGGFNPFEKY